MAEILIAEDARLQKALIQRFVQPEHTVVGIVGTEDGAVSFAVRHEPDVAIIDINLSEGNGIAVADRISSYDIGTELIISTAVTDEEIKDSIEGTSVDAFLVKPYSKRVLLNAIEQAR